MSNFKSLTSAELLDIILRGAQAQAVLQGNGQSDEAMYYVLRERVNGKLKEKYKTHEHVFLEDFEDVVDVAYVLSCYCPSHEEERIATSQAFREWRATSP